MKIHEVISYVGLPWEPGARGPKAFDCWGLIVDIYSKHLIIELPLFPHIDRNQISDLIEGFDKYSADWDLLKKPVEFAVVGMGLSSKTIGHCGIFLKGKILHSTRGTGVVCESLGEVKKKFKTVKFYGIRNTDK
jgi:cell wall-associated NlpC family hydrolase